MAVARAVRDCNWPCSASDISREAGDQEVTIVKGFTCTIDDILPKLKTDYFETEKEFRRAVQQHWEGIRQMAVPEAQRPTQGQPAPGGRPQGRAAKGRRDQERANSRRGGKRLVGTRGRTKGRRAGTTNRRAPARKSKRTMARST